jgi:hypothetical protein
MVWELDHRAAARVRIDPMKLLLGPWNAGVSAAKHLRWYLSYQISGETRPDAE